MASRKTFIKEIQEEKEKTLSAFIDMKGPEAAADNNQDGSGSGSRVKERRTERVNLIVSPRLKEDIHKIAHMKRTSINSIANLLMEKYIEENKTLIDKYNDIFGEDEEI